MVVAPAAAALRRRTSRPDCMPSGLIPRIRIAVTGRHGQVCRSLVERAQAAGAEIICIGRPTLDLGDAGTIDSALTSLAADVLVSAAAYTDVNKAEAEPDRAELINGRAP